MIVCPLCLEPIQDGEIGEVKNYPEDGRIAVFFDCPNPNCPGEDIEGIYQPVVKRDNQESYGEIVKRKKDD
jgi:hypothetical protein